MLDDILIKCMRATSSDEEPRSIKESVETIGTLTDNTIDVDQIEVVEDDPVTITKLDDNNTLDVEPKELDESVLSEDDEFDYDDSEDDLTYDDKEDSATPVIDTDLSASDEEKVDIEDYVGKYVVVCPHCLKPLFSDAPSGEIYCPVCDEQVEIDHSEGVVVKPEDEDSDDEGESEEVTSDEESEEEVVVDDDEDKDDEKDEESLVESYKTLSDLVDDRTMNDEADKINNLLGQFSILKKLDEFDTKDKEPEEDFSSLTIYKDNDGKYVILDKGDKSVYQVESKEKSDESCEVKEESVDVSICPEGSVTIHDDAAETTVTVAPQKDEEVCPECSECPVVAPEEVAPEVDDFEVDKFDDDISMMVNDIYDEESDLKYETKKVTRNKERFVIEGLVSSSKGSKLVKFVCENLNESRNRFKVEGLTGLVGSIICDTEYVTESKQMKVNKVNYRFISKVEGLVKVIDSRKFNESK